jgi:hypothetical protein
MLAILYAPEGQKPLSVARINDQNLLSAAAAAAVFEAEQAASELLEEDETLGLLQLEEAAKLRRVLSLLLPACTGSVQTNFGVPIEGQVRDAANCPRGVSGTLLAMRQNAATQTVG